MLTKPKKSLGFLNERKVIQQPCEQPLRAEKLSGS